MKIGLVCPYDLFRGGGVQEHVLAQAAELTKRGHTVKILTPRPANFKGKPPKNVLFVGNSAKVRTPIKTTLELGASLGRDTLDDLLLSEEFDVLHIHEPEVPFLGAQIVARASCPIVATFHAIHPDTPMAWTIEAFRIPYSRSIFSRLTEITAVSEVAAGFVSERTKRRVAIIPNGINLAHYQKVVSKPKLPRLPTALLKRSKVNQKTILYVGRLEKRKGVKWLIKAFAILAAQDKDVRLIIAGDGSDRQKLEDWVRTHRVPRIKFLGYVSDKEKRKLFETADVFCSPALYGESFGIVLLEAMAMGVVTVAGDNPGYRALLADTGKISLVNPKHSVDFADRLAMLLHQEDLRQAWIKWANEYVQQFDYPLIIDRYEKLYKKLVV